MTGGVQDHEVVSIYPLDADQLEKLLTTQNELVFNWATSDSWPVGVIHSFVWKDGRIWVTCAAHRHRVAAVRRNPKVSVVVTSTGTAIGPGKSVTIKGRCVIPEDPETKQWFYHDLAYKGLKGDAAADFEARLHSPLRVVLEVIPEKWITFDGAKFAADTAGVLPEQKKGPRLESDTLRLARELRSRGIAR